MKKFVPLLFVKRLVEFIFMFDKAGRDILVHNDSYALSKILDSDREEYVELQRQINGDETLFLNPLCKDIMWDVTTSYKSLFIILDNEGNFCGSVELKDESRTPEIGISILDKCRNKGIARNAISLLIELTYNHANIDYYLVRIESSNSHSRHVFEKMGAKYIGEEISTLDRFKEYLEQNNFEHKMNELTDLYTMFESDERVVRYKLEPKENLCGYKNN